MGGVWRWSFGELFFGQLGSKAKLSTKIRPKAGFFFFGSPYGEGVGGVWGWSFGELVGVTKWSFGESYGLRVVKG